MPQINQLVAIANGRKADTQKVLTKLYHLVQHRPSFEGFVRVDQLHPAASEQSAPAYAVFVVSSSSQGLLLPITGDETFITDGSVFQRQTSLRRP